MTAQNKATSKHLSKSLKRKSELKVVHMAKSEAYARQTRPYQSNRQTIWKDGDDKATQKANLYCYLPS